MSGYKYVPDGVFLACNQGTETSNLKITHVKNAHLYNNQLYATDRDVEPVNIGCFGNCRELNTKCKYQKGIWQKVHPTLSVEGAAPILDEISYLECPYKGKITIHFDKASAEAISNKNATEKDGINWGRIGNHLLDKGKGLLQGALLGVAIVGGCALIGGVIGFFGGGGVGAVPGAVAGAKVGMAILTGLGVAATVKSVSDTYKSGERLIESTNKVEDGIIFAIDLSETIIMMLGLKKGIKGISNRSYENTGIRVGKIINNVLGEKNLNKIGNGVEVGTVTKLILGEKYFDSKGNLKIDTDIMPFRDVIKSKISNLKTKVSQTSNKKEIIGFYKEKPVVNESTKMMAEGYTGDGKVAYGVNQTSNQRVNSSGVGKKNDFITNKKWNQFKNNPSRDANVFPETLHAEGQTIAGLGDVRGKNIYIKLKSPSSYKGLTAPCGFCQGDMASLAKYKGANSLTIEGADGTYYWDFSYKKAKLYRLDTVPPVFSTDELKNDK